MRTIRTRLRPTLPWLLASLAIAGCTASAVVARGGAPERPLEPRSATALPERDPTTRATVRDPAVITPTEQVAVRVTTGPQGGGIKVVEVLSPRLSPAEQEALRHAVESGDLKLAPPPAEHDESWIITIPRPAH
jgi:hypothetical protein